MGPRRDRTLRGEGWAEKSVGVDRAEQRLDFFADLIPDGIESTIVHMLGVR